MYIKSMILDGFKSYGRELELKDFDKHFNAITGFNGTGKSNLLDALCFVLGISQFDRVRARSSRELVYKNGQAHTSTAYVSVTFDNTDRNFVPYGFEDVSEITLGRRVATDGKNSYFINDSKVPRKRFVDMLCSVHLNVNNPHFLILQGHITKVLNMKPQEIVSMIEEAVGMQTYQTKRNAAFALLDKKERMMETIDECLESEIIPYIKKAEENLKKYFELQKAQEELNRLERLHVAFKFVSLETDIENCKERLENVNISISSKEDNIATAINEVRQLSAAIDINATNPDQEVVQTLKSLEEDLQRCEEEKAVLNAKLRSHLDSMESERKRMKQVGKFIQEEEAALAVKKCEMEKFNEDFETLLQAKASDAEAYAAAVNKFEAVNAGLLSNEDGQAATLQEQLIAAQSALVKAQTTKKEMQMQLTHLQSEVASKEKALSTCISQDELDVNLAALNQEVANLAAELKKLQFDENIFEKLQQDASSLKKEIDSNLQCVDLLRSRNAPLTFHYEKPEPDFDHSRVLGLVCRMFTVRDEVFMRAIEVVGGSKLFHVIADNEDTCKAILSKGQLKCRTTLIPLNRILSKTIEKNTALLASKLAGKNKALPAIQLIEFKPEIRAAMEWVFGDTFVCIDSTAARICAFDSRILKRSVTLDGDIFDPSGILSGGSVNKSPPVLSALKELKGAEDLLHCNEDKLKILNQKIETMSKTAKKFSRIHQLHSLKSREAQLLISRLSRSEQKQLEEYISNGNHQIKKIIENLSRMEEEIKEHKNKVKKLELKVGNSKDIYHEELKAAKEETERLELISKKSCQEWKNREQDYLTLKMEMEELQNTLKASQMEMTVHEQSVINLNAKCSRIQEDIKTIEEKAAQCSSVIKTMKEKVLRASSSVKKVEDRISFIRGSLGGWELDKKKAEYKKQNILKEINKKEQVKNRLLANNDWISADQEHFGIAGGKYDFKDIDSSQLVCKIENLQTKISQLRISTPEKQKMSELKRMKEKLFEVQHQRKIVLKDKTDLLKSVNELDDLRKHQFTMVLRRVNDSFGRIFSTLLPHAHVKLVPLPRKSVMQGLEVKVAFGNIWKDNLSELSGGQRSLIALSLVFAILTINPAPIYILDEVDAALDDSHTRNIGLVLKNHFPQSQFIVVSLKEKLFEHANVLFKTCLNNNVSSVIRASPGTNSRRIPHISI